MKRNLFLPKANSKKGFTIVEVVCAVCVLVIFTVAIITLLTTTHNSILKTSVADNNAAKVESVLDELVDYTVNNKISNISPNSWEGLFDDDDKVECVTTDFDSTDLNTVQYKAETVQVTDSGVNNTGAVKFTATMYYTVGGNTEHITYSSIAYLNGLGWGVSDSEA